MMIRYVVQPGDSLWKIAKRFGTNIDTIVRMNGIIDPDKIYPRQVLRIWIEEEEEKVPEESVGEEGNTYVVQSGDTLYIIAQRFGTTVPNLININGLSNPDRLNIGDRLIIQ
ncbi:MAG: LysM peptidoglycan-binding domain-containing protein [Acutalibacteraceae bacterium]